jgi:putative transposase
VTFIQDHKQRFGVEPICCVLTEHGCKITPEHVLCPPPPAPPARAVRDAQLVVEITRVHADPTIGRGLYGARKVLHQLTREGVQVARCRVER